MPDVLQRSILLPGPTPVPRGQGAGPAIARGLAEFGEAGAQAALQWADQIDARQVTEARLQGVRKLNELTRELRDDPDPDTAVKRYDERVETLGAELGEGLSGRGQRVFSEQFGRLIEGERERVAAHAERRISSRAVARLEEGLAELAQDAAAAETPQQRAAFLATGTASIRDLEFAGDLTAEEAQRRRAAFLSDADEVTALQTMAGDPRAALKALNDRERFTGLEPLKRERLKERARSEIAALDRAARMARTESRVLARAGLAQLNDIVREGLPPDAGFVTDLAGQVRAAADAGIAARFKSLLALSDKLGRLRGAAPDELQDRINAVAADIGGSGATPEKTDELKGLERLQTRQAAELGRDPLSWAARQGQIDLEPLNFGQGTTPEQLQARIRQGDRVAAYYGVAPRYLTDEEADRLSESVRKGAPEQQAVLAAGIVAGAGPDKAPEIFRQVAKDDTVFAHAGGLLSQGTQFARSARDALAGRKAIEANKDLLPSSGDMDARVVAVLGNALPRNPATRGAIIETAKAIYAARIIAEGGRKAGQMDQALFDRALDEAAGAWFDTEGRQWGGVASYRGAEVIVPPTIRADRFERAVKRLTDLDLELASAGGRHGGGKPVFANGEAFTADQLDEVWLVNVGAGRFYLSQTRPGRGTAGELTLVMNESNRPYVLDLNRLAESQPQDEGGTE